MTEDELLANARFMAEHLLDFGWDTVVGNARSGARQRWGRTIAP